MGLKAASTVTLVAGALALTLVSQTAGAHSVEHTDANDVRHALDVRETERTKVPMGEYTGVKFIVRMHDRFSEQDLNQGGIRINLDSRGDSSMDFYLLMNLYEGSYPECSLYDSRGFSEHAATISVGRRFVSCALPRYALRANKNVRWQARAMHSGAVDRAPESGWYKH